MCITKPAGAALALVAVLCGPVHANCVIGVPPPTYYVGSDSQCQYATIQAAINAVPSPTSCAPNIVIAAEHAWTEHLSIMNRSLTLTGSTAGCGSIITAPNAADAATSGPALTLDGSGNTASSVVTITGSSAVTIRSIEITGGDVAGTGSLGGGISFTGSGSLVIDGSTVDANQAALGAGIGIDPASGSVSLTLQDGAEVSGNTASDTGGGIYLAGSGTVSIGNSSVDHNQANYGGGIDMSPSATATLTLGANALVTNNMAASSGGGIRLEGSTRMYMLSDGSTVSFNTAQGNFGGGIEVVGPARADIGSSGAAVVSAVSFNTAPYGGGLAILGSTGDGTARLFTTNALQPVMVSNNTATIQGGGIFIKTDSQYDSSASLCAYNYRIDDNSAPDGAAIYGEYDRNTTFNLNVNVFLNPPGNCGPESPASLGATACAANTPCNEVSGNSAVDGSNQAAGSIITMNTYQNLAVDRLEMRGNFGLHMTDISGGVGGSSYLEGCLIAGNHSVNELIREESYTGGDVFQLGNCTLADNTIDNGYVIYAISRLVLTDSIIAQPGNSSLDYVQSDCYPPDDPCFLDVSYMLASEIASLGANGTTLAIQPGAPLFVDAAHGDYHLPVYIQNGAVTASAAVDFAPTETGDATLDLEGNAYAQDVPAVPNLFGSRDLGAYEMTPITDRVFADAFGDPVSLVR